LPLTIAVTPTRFHPRQAARVTIAAGLVTMGFFIGVIPEGNLPVSSIPSSRSLVFGVFSSLSIAVHSVLVKSSLSYCNNSTIQLAYWTNAGSAILLAPFVLLHGEPAKIAELIATSEWKMNVFVVGSLVTGSFGFLLCVAGLLSIKVTSPITHMFSSVRPRPSHFSCLQFSHYSPSGCSLGDTDALGGLDIWGCFDYVRLQLGPSSSHSHVRYVAVTARYRLRLFLAEQCGLLPFDLASVFNCLCFRFYTWTKATEQVQPQASPNSTDLEAFDKAKGDKFGGDDRHRREKEMLSD
jgi:hypothetical protein